MSRKESEDYGENRRNVKEFRGIDQYTDWQKRIILIRYILSFWLRCYSGDSCWKQYYACCIWVGCMNSHGYERTSIQAIEDCARLTLAMY